MMTEWLKYLRSLVPPRPPAATHADLRKAARRIVARKARGNVRLQMGRYLTRPDLDTIRERVLAHRFHAD